MLPIYGRFNRHRCPGGIGFRVMPEIRLATEAGAQSAVCPEDVIRHPHKLEWAKNVGFT
jgi:hypothetical protein